MPERGDLYPLLLRLSSYVRKEGTTDMDRSINPTVEDPIRLIIVDDDDDYREVAAAEFVELGFAVQGFADGETMLASIADGVSGDVIVLDWTLPVLSGIDLLSRIRGRGVLTPVVFLTGRATPVHENLAFDGGAVDFVDKSRGVPIVAKRLRGVVEAAQRSAELAADGRQQCGRLVLKPRGGGASWDDVDVNLTKTECNIVRLLALNVGNHVTYRAVYDCMHHVGFIGGSGNHGYRTNVRSSIKRIRNKFRLVDADFAEVENYPSFGYRWGEAQR